MRAHLQLNHPGCPEDVAKYVIYMLRRERWDVPLGTAVGITLQNHVRHHLTNYDSFYRIPGLAHEEARLIVRDEVKGIIASRGPTIRMRPAKTGVTTAE